MTLVLGILSLLFNLISLFSVALFIGSLFAHYGNFEYTKTINFLGFKIEIQFCKKQPLAFLINKKKL